MKSKVQTHLRRFLLPNRIMLGLKAVFPPLPVLAHTASPATHKASFPCNNSLKEISILQPLQKWQIGVGSKRVPLHNYQPVTWEGPEESDASDDEGQWSDSEKEEEEEEEKEESISTVSATSSATNQRNGKGDEFEELVKEVELLLEPEEKAILQKNEAPVLSKISSVKWSPFHTLTLSGQIGFMDRLLEQGFDVDSIDKEGFTALHLAVISKKEAVVSHLLRKGANPRVKDRDGATPLHFAVQVGAMQTVKLLIKYKVDVNVADDEGWTPLHVAIQSRCRDIAKVLLVNGADKTRRTKDGKTPLDLSLCYGKEFKSYELAKLLKLVPADRDP